MIGLKAIALLVGIFCTSVTCSLCQDIHFSQFMSSPSTLSPAQTGQFEGAYRFAANARSQWHSVTVPYQTFGISADAKNFLHLRGLGSGVSLYTDRTGDSRLTTTAANIALAYTFRINKDSTQFITLGAQSGITQRLIDYSELNYDKQYNGTAYDPAQSSGEGFSNNGRIYPNLNTGVSWTRRLHERNLLTVGTALFNINKPQQSFLNNKSILLDQRWNIYTLSQIKISKKVDVLPALNYMSQGTFREFTLGGSVKYILRNKGNQYRAVYAGLWTRTLDAGWISAGMDFNSLYTGISYDINYSNLTPASNARGGIEVSIIYIVKNQKPKRKSYKICPTFI